MVQGAASIFVSAAFEVASNLKDSMTPAKPYPTISGEAAPGSGGLSTTDTITNVPGSSMRAAPAQQSMTIDREPDDESSDETDEDSVEINESDAATAARIPAPIVISEGNSSQARQPSPTSSAGSDHGSPVVQPRPWIADMRSPSPESDPDRRTRDPSHDTTVTSFVEYHEGDDAGNNGSTYGLPPLRLGSFKKEYSKSYREFIPEGHPTSCVQGEESFLVGEVLPPMHVAR